MSRHDLGRIEAIIAQIQSIDADARDKYLERLKSKDPELHAEVLRFIGDVEDGFLEGTSDRIWASVNPGTDLIGRTIRQYRIEDVVGRGGMGVVYKALDTKLGRHVALKFLPDRLRTDEAARERFMNEAQAVARLDHPNICAIYAVEETDNGVPFLAMALYEGETLRERLAEGPISTREAESVLSQTAAGLSAAHAKGFIHRDIKPDNLFITTSGTVKILDFGIAAAKDDQSAADDEGMMGTVTYMSPEQAQGESATELSDVWALGAVGYEMMTGKSPFHAANRRATMNRILNEKPDALPSETPRRLQRVIEKCLQKDSTKRFSRAGDVGAFLTRTRALGRMPARTKKVMAFVIVAALVTGVWLGSLFGLIDLPGSKKKVLDVVPFTTSSEDSVVIATVTGFSEVIRESLGRRDEIQVRDGYRGFDDLSTYISDVSGEESDEVDYVLGADMSITNGTVRLRPVLYSYSDDDPIWEQDYKFPQDEFQSFRERMLDDILTRLTIELDLAGEQPDAGETNDPEAYPHYLRGMGILKLRTPADLPEASRQFREAISLDNQFSSAYASLSQTIALSQSTGYVIEPDPDKYEQARMAAQRAIDLDSTNGIAHMALAFVLHNFDWDWEGAEREYLLATKYNPQNADVLHFYSTHLAELGKLDDAEDKQFKATLISPEAPHYFAGYAMHLYLNEKYQKVLNEAEEFPPEFSDFYVYQIWRSFALMELERFEEAEEAIARVEETATSHHPMVLHLRGLWHAKQDNAVAARRYADLLEGKSPTLIAAIHHELGDFPTALDHLERGLNPKDPYMTVIGVWPSLSDICGEPRFQDVLREMGLDRTRCGR